MENVKKWQIEQAKRKAFKIEREKKKKSKRIERHGLGFDAITKAFKEAGK